MRSMIYTIIIAVIVALVIAAWVYDTHRNAGAKHRAD